MATEREYSASSFREKTCVVALAAALLASAIPALAADGQSDAVANPNAEQRAQSERLFNSVVKVQTRASPNARTGASLGMEREGTGVVIGDEGLVLTIGYLLIEAEEVRLTDAHGKSIPAKIVAYDHASGIGLLRATTPIDAKPMPLGDSGDAKERTPVMIVTYEGRDEVTLGFVVSRRLFTGNWEYQIDDAIFTAPPTLKWSGAALVDSEGRLLGVGSLIVRDAMRGDTTLPGNMFVPINVVKSVLPDLVKTGHRAGPPRPWLGVNADELQGRLFVARVSPGGPAEKAGIEPGDIILAVGSDGVHTQSDLYGRLWNYGPAGTDIPLRVLHDIDVRDIKVHSIDRMEYFSARSTY